MAKRLTITMRDYIYDLYITPIKERNGNVSAVIEELIHLGTLNYQTNKNPETNEVILKNLVRAKDIEIEALRKKIISLERGKKEKTQEEKESLIRLAKHKGIIKSGILREVTKGL